MRRKEHVSLRPHDHGTPGAPSDQYTQTFGAGTQEPRRRTARRRAARRASLAVGIVSLAATATPASSLVVRASGTTSGPTVTVGQERATVTAANAYAMPAASTLAFAGGTVALSSGLVSLPSSSRGGIGYVSVSPSLDGAEACTLATPAVCTPFHADAPLPTMLQEFTVAVPSTSPVTVHTASGHATLGTITGHLDTALQGAVDLVVPSASVTPVLMTCATLVPTANCGTDPVAFPVPTNAATALHGEAMSIEGRLYKGPSASTSPYYGGPQLNGLYWISGNTTNPTVASVPLVPSPVSPQSTALPILQSLCQSLSALCGISTTAPTARTQNQYNYFITYEYTSVYENKYNDLLREEFDSGGAGVTCWNNDCSAMDEGQYGPGDVSWDGNAVSWAGSWAINYLSAQADLAVTNICSSTASWTFTPVSGQTYTPGWYGNVRINTLSQNALGMQSLNGAYVTCNGTQYPSALFGWGTGADLEEGHYHDEFASVDGDYVHSWNHTDWNYTFGCGATDCVIGITPATSTSAQSYHADPNNYEY
jgi:hypothetical protein